jgi:glycosyltransferase involved in cell wall biosynthesis
MTNTPEITFIICSYNRSDYLDDTLQSLLDHFPSDSPSTILVVDNNSTDNTAEVVRRHQNSLPKDENPIRYIKETKQGLSHARNRGIKEAETPYVVFLDDDIKATASLIPAWQSFFADYPDAAAAGGKNHVQFDAPRPTWMSYFLLPLLAYHDLGDSIKKYSAGNYPVGCNMGFKKTIFDQVGLFDTDLGRKGKSLNAGEEKELFKRIRELDKDVFYLPDAFLYHRVGAERLTVDYIRKQALGLGLSMRLRLKKATLRQKLTTWGSEWVKLFGSIPLGLYYCLGLKPSRATMLFKFRWWIWQGYRQSS